ncbi:alpha/beta hydrolase family esterase [Actinopolymorpha pittospori]
MPSPRRSRVSLRVAMVAMAATALTAVMGCGPWSGANPRHHAAASPGLPNAGVSPAGADDPNEQPLPGAEPSSPTPSHPPLGPEEVRLASGRVYVLPDQARPRPGASRPLLLVLHSFGGTWQRLRTVGRFEERAARLGFVVAYGIGADRSWNAGSCCGWSQSRDADDVGYLVSVAADVRRRIPDVDPRRIYLTGFSNGAMMTLRALCERPRVFAAGVGVAGQLVGRCAGGAPIHYLEIHGTVDAVVPYAGGRVGWLGVTFPPVSGLPARVRAGAPGSVVEIRTHPCGHVWPTGDQCGLDAAEVGWEFLSRYALPASTPHHAAGHEATR